MFSRRAVKDEEDDGSSLSRGGKKRTGAPATGLRQPHPPHREVVMSHPGLARGPAEIEFRRQPIWPVCINTE